MPTQTLNLGLASLLMLLGATGSTPAQDVKAVARSLQPSRILADIKALASDEFEGRAPGTPGEEKTVKYLVDQLKGIGLKPGNPDGSYVQAVPLVGFQVTASKGSLDLEGGKSVPLTSKDDWVAVSRRFQPEVKVENSDIVFVGYGVDAPEYGWDDYKGVDVRGKTIVMLVNDPPVVDPANPDQLDNSLFKGKAMTYYGRWTYKFEIASKKGAAAALLVHETGPAGYPYSVVVGSWGRENFDIAGDDPTKRVAVEAWISLETTKKLCMAANLDFDALKASARTKAFRPVTLNGKANLSVTSELRKVDSKNVVGLLEGSDPKLKNQYVVYTGHWDHLGRDPNLTGDQIFNGAADNASGVASILEIARGFTQVQPPPKRSVLFLLVTAEEKGLLGAKYYASHPLYPIEATVANINLDVTNLWGRTTDVTNVGEGMNTLDLILADVAKSAGKRVKPDAEPEKGFYYRSDHFEFARVGVPALDPKGGSDFIGKPADFAQKTREDYTKNHYHKVSDEVRDTWDLSGAAEDAGMMLEVGYRVAQDVNSVPEWNAGTEFKAIRDTSAAARKPAP